MNKLFSILLFVIPFLANAQAPAQQPKPTQKVDYQFQGQKDSFFLDEIVTALDSTGKSIGVTKTSQLFRSEAQVLDYIQYLKNQAASARQQAKAVVEKANADAKKSVDEANAQAKKWLEAAPRIESAADKIEAVAKVSGDVFTGKKTDKPPTKPKKKKKG